MTTANIKTPTIVDESTAMAVSTGMGGMVVDAEINQQIRTAKQYPRRMELSSAICKPSPV